MPTRRFRPIRVLELRSIRGTGGGPEKTILHGAAAADPSRFAVTVCYIRDHRDTQFEIDARAASTGVDYVEIVERHSMDLSVWPALRRLVRERQIDIVHAHEYKTDIVAYLLSKVEPIVPMATAHGWTGHSRRELGFYYPLDKRVLARYPRVVAVSGEIRSELIAAGANPERVRVVLNGIDPQKFTRAGSRHAGTRTRYGFDPADVVIGAVGRLEPQKRFDLLIAAVAVLRPRYPRLKLLIAGEGSLRASLEGQIARAGLEGVVVLAGHCTDIGEFHQVLNLFVQSSVYEGTPNVVLEAMALETPVIATDVGGTSELLRDGVDGTIVPPLNERALIAAVEEALQNSSRTRARAVAARHRIETDLSFKVRMAKVESMYEELMSHRLPISSGATWSAVERY